MKPTNIGLPDDSIPSTDIMLSTFYFIAGSLVLILNTINYYFNTKLSNIMYVFYLITFIFSILPSVGLVIYLQNIKNPNVAPIFSLLSIYVIILIIVVSLININSQIIYSNLCYYILLSTCIINFLLCYEISSQHKNSSSRSPENFKFTSFTYRITLIIISLMAFMLYPLIIKTNYYITDGFQTIHKYNNIYLI